MANSSMPLMFQPLIKFAEFNGRARRSEYWLFFLFQILVSLALGTIGIFPGMKVPMDGLSNIFALAMLIPNISVGVRRFHDINRTGWWTIFQLVVLIVAFVIYFVIHGTAFVATVSEIDWQAVQSEDGTATLDMFQSLTPMLLWVFLPWWIASLVTFVFHVLDGTHGANRFGPDPKGSSVDASVF